MTKNKQTQVNNIQTQDIENHIDLHRKSDIFINKQETATHLNPERRKKGRHMHVKTPDTRR